MASPVVIHVTGEEDLVFCVEPRGNSQKVNELLQKNHEENHAYFSSTLFHNHLVHHMLSMYALGADESILQEAYDNMVPIQRRIPGLDMDVVKSMADPTKFKQYLGNERHYHNFMVFYQQEIARTSWQNVVDEYLLKGDDRADDMLSRTFAALHHGMIHLGFAIEFQQPTLIAESLAQASTHSNWALQYLLTAERQAGERDYDHVRGIAQLIDDVHDDPDVARVTQWEDPNKIRDGVLARAGNKMTAHAANWANAGRSLDYTTAELINAAAYFSGCAQRPDKEDRFDFYYIHSLNGAMFFKAFADQPWIRVADKARLLEWKVRHDLAMYVSRGSPDLHLEAITEYQPRRPSKNDADPWKSIFDRANAIRDDGHAVKLVRALAAGQKICKPWEDSPDFRVKQRDWLNLAHMALDAFDSDGPNWVQSAGFDVAWDKIPDRKE